MKLYFLPLLSIILLSFCGCDKKDGPTYGVGEPNLNLILNDSHGQNLLSAISNGNAPQILKSEHQVTYKVNGMPHVIEPSNEFDDCLSINKLERKEGKPLALRPLPYDFGRKLIEVAKETPDYQCHAKVSLKCHDIFKDDKTHTIEMDLEYCGNKRYEILQVKKGTLSVDGIPAEYIDYQTYRIGLTLQPE